MVRAVTGRRSLKRRPSWAVRSRVSERLLRASAGRSWTTTTARPSARRRTAGGADGTARSSRPRSARQPSGTTTENAPPAARKRAGAGSSFGRTSSVAASAATARAATQAVAMTRRRRRGRAPAARDRREAMTGSAKDEVAIRMRAAVDVRPGDVAQPESELAGCIGSHGLGREPALETGGHLEDRAVAVLHPGRRGLDDLAAAGGQQVRVGG